MNIFNDAARPHRATWLSPFFVVIEFSKAMWQNDHGFKNRLPGVAIKTSFVRLKKDNLPSCLSDGLVWLLHWLKTEGCAHYLTAQGRCRRRMARNKYSHYSSRPQLLCGMTATHVLLCACCQECTIIRRKKNPWTIRNNLFMRGTLSTSGGIQK